MLQSIVISNHVLETIKSLPLGEQEVITNALAADLFLGKNPDDVLSPFHAMVYSMIRDYVRRDSERAGRSDVNEAN